MDNHRDLMRFEAKVVKQTSGCWHWNASKKGGGYGAFWLRGSLRGAHRASLFLYKGQPLETPLDAMHSCDTPGCVNPDHLAYGTRTQNMRDASEKGRTVRVGDWTGMNNPKAKLTTDQRLSLEKMLQLGHKKADIALEFGVTAVRVQQIAREAKPKKDGGGYAVEEF